MIARPLREIAGFSLGLAIVVGLAHFWALQSGVYSLFAGEHWAYVAITAASFGLVCLLLYRYRIGKQLAVKQVKVSIEKLRMLAWILSLVFMTSIVLFVVLLAGPDFSSYPMGVDPTNWPPFSWGSVGYFLYQASVLVWFFVAFILLPLVVMQVSILERIWRNLGKREGTIHVALVRISIVVALFTVTIGQYIMSWLAD